MSNRRASTRPPAIDIVAGKTFTVAKVGKETVAVRWGRYVTDGTGAAVECGSEAEAASELMRIALAAPAGGGI